LRLASIRAEHFAIMAGEIRRFVTPGMAEFLNFLNEKGQKLFIISGGFIDLIRPVAELFNIPDENCFVNEYTLDANGNIVGVKEGPLLYEGGKSAVVRELKKQNRLPGTVTMVGDGMSDYQVYAEGLADLFIGCGFNIVRPNVKAKSPIFIETSGELLLLISN
jgi:HAD superfamily phosphoserine phosphatase-like hydrolase